MTIGLVASNRERANRVINELGLKAANVLSIPANQVSVAGRGWTLSALLVDETARSVDLADLMPCLLGSGGHAYRLERITS